MARSIRPTRVFRRSGEDPDRPVATAVAVADPLRAAHEGGRRGELVDLGGHQPVAGEGRELADQVVIGALLDQLTQRHPVVGHRRRLRVASQVSQPEPIAKTGGDRLACGAPSPDSLKGTSKYGG